MSLTTNITSLTALNRMRLTGLEQTTAMERLSSGLRINRGADDPSGLAISTGMKARARGLAAASANAQDGLKMLGVMDGSLVEIQNMLMRMRDLAVRASNEAALTDADRDKLQNEARGLRDGIDQIARTTKYNSKDLLYVDGDFKNGQEVQLTNEVPGNFISISGDGSTVVYNKGGDIYIANGNGTDVRQLTSGPEIDNTASNNAISHDGTRFVFQRDGVLYSMKSDGSGLTLLDNTSVGGFTNIYISGDGKKVIYSKNTNNDVFICDFDGSNKLQLTNTPGVTENQYSIDEQGTKVSFSRAGGGGQFMSSMRTGRVKRSYLLPFQAIRVLLKMESRFYMPIPLRELRLPIQMGQTKYLSLPGLPPAWI